MLRSVKKLRMKVVSLVATVMVVGTPLTAWTINVADGDLYYNGGQTKRLIMRIIHTEPL